VEIAAAADTTVVLLAPGMGDGIQAAKAGILEIGDVFVVNKADREGASSTARELRAMIALSDKDAAEENDNDDQQWTPPVVTSVASTGEGVVDVAEAIDAHARWACEHGELTRRRLLRAVEEITSTLAGLLRSRLESEPLSEQVQQVAQEVATGRVDVHRAAERLWERVVDSGAR
jgi:Putative periplasmic protein kinase ArgK and related GTPases of G3E family